MDLRELNLIRELLNEFVDLFRPDLGRSKRVHWCKLYISGLLLNGERKSIQPMAKRLPGGDEQSLQQFVNQSPWNYENIQNRLAQHLAKSMNIKKGVLILDDTSLPKKGKFSVGVGRQYCGALGKVANCQSIVTWHYSEIDGEHFPISGELFLPQSWTNDRKRIKAVKIPEKRFQFLKKWQLALQNLDHINTKNFPYEAIAFDAGYGEVREFLGELDQRQLTFVAQIPESHSYWPLDIELNIAQNSIGMPRQYSEIANKKFKPLSAKKWLEKTLQSGNKWQKVKLNLKSKEYTEVLIIRVKEVITQAFYRPGPDRWLIIEKFGKDQYKYYVSNASEDTPKDQMVLWIHERWKIEQGYQQLKEELGLDHFEGRSWLGLHHHITLCFMAFGFLTLLKNRSRGKKNNTVSSSNKKSTKQSISHYCLPLLQNSSQCIQKTIF
jgi:SRSO17 transposase